MVMWHDAVKQIMVSEFLKLQYLLYYIVAELFGPVINWIPLFFFLFLYKVFIY